MTCPICKLARCDPQRVLRSLGMPTTKGVNDVAKNTTAKRKPLPAIKCQYGAVGNRKKGNRIGVGVQLDDVPDGIAGAIDLFTNAQVDVHLASDGNAKGDATGQTKMEHATPKIAGVHFTGDILKFSCDGRRVSFSLLTPTTVSIDRLAEFSFRDGELYVERKGDSNAASEPGD